MSKLSRNEEKLFGSRYNVVKTTNGMILRVDDQLLRKMQQKKKIAYVLSFREETKDPVYELATE